MPNIVLAHEVPYDWLHQEHNPFLSIVKFRSTWRSRGNKYEIYKQLAKEKTCKPSKATGTHGDWYNHADSMAKKPQLKVPKEYIHADRNIVHSDRPHGDWNNHGDSG